VLYKHSGADDYDDGSGGHPSHAGEAAWFRREHDLRLDARGLSKKDNIAAFSAHREMIDNVLARLPTESVLRKGRQEVSIGVGRGRWSACHLVANGFW
jgi:hypothetical protein